ncbi:hypothetical protein [Methylobrevis pamukkalensis]|uniref:hypothetical protein n=1 Tax=Methylobrevis pamukkalensis TaxID=1439726 RepID=UPI001AECAF03|nr:hypothetical protein [Methylobrevis pamukkalensis]
MIDGVETWARHLETLWSRYRRPIAITECHLGCDCPDEQARWFAECWSEALAARRAGSMSSPSRPGRWWAARDGTRC